MQKSRHLRRSLAAIAICSIGAAAHAQEAQWEFSLTPYVWLPNLNGTLKYGFPPGAGSRPDVETGPNDYLENLSAVLMLSGEARKGAWAFYGDLIYLRFESEDSKVREIDFITGGSNSTSTLDSGTTSELNGLTWTLGASRTVVSNQKASLDILAGLRYLNIDASSDWRLSAAIGGPGGAVFPASGRIARETELWDGVVGVRGRVHFGTGKWSAPYYFDIGLGSSELTWQAMAGVAYSFGWGDMTLAYRHLFYDQADDELLQDFAFSGFAIGATFRF